MTDCCICGLPVNADEKAPVGIDRELYHKECRAVERATIWRDLMTDMDRLEEIDDRRISKSDVQGQ